MNEVFKLEYKSGPHGDACTTYTIHLLKSHVTLRDFMGDLPRNEWGCLYIEVINPATVNLPYATEKEKYMEVRVEYKQSLYVCKDNNFNAYLDCEIDTENANWANGGWGCMDYWIKLKQ